MTKKIIQVSLKGEGIQRIFLTAFAVVSIIPPLAFLFVTYRYHISFKLDVIIFFITIIILSTSGMLMLWKTMRRIRFLRDALVNSAQEGKGTEASLSNAHFDSMEATEVQEINQIVVEFQNLLKELRQNTSKLERIVYQITTLSELAELTASIADIDELMNVVLAKTMKGVGADKGSILILDNKKGYLTIASAKGLPKDVIKNTHIETGRGIAGLIFKRGEPVLVEDVYKNDFYRKLSRVGQGSFICLPLKVRNNTIGVLNVSKESASYAFNNNDLMFLTTLLNHFAFALENARLLSEAKKNAKGLGEILREKSSELDYVRQQAVKMEAVGTLAGGVAHDFNNLLTGILGNVSLMLLETNPNNPSYEELKNIETQAQSGAQLTKQLLGFARSGKYEVKPTDMNELIRKSAAMFARTKKELTIQTSFQEDIWRVEVDKVQIEQVLLNLYVNAWHAMPGGGKLYLKTENVALDQGFVKPYEVVPGKYVRISLIDTGVGMDEATKQRIFDPFFTTKEMGRGTGLGLASAYGIIKNHDGIITVHSEKGKGTKFNIYMPASEIEAVIKEDIPADILKGSETILLVDDEAVIINTGEKLLKALGYNVFATMSGKKAIEIYRKNREKIDMVILDMIMPNMNGGKTYDNLKKVNPGIKVLLSSGYNINGQAREILKRGCNGFIQKPFDIRQMSKKVREVLDEKSPEYIDVLD